MDACRAAQRTSLARDRIESLDSIENGHRLLLRLTLCAGSLRIDHDLVSGVFGARECATRLMEIAR
jgi:hypothetical protein